MPTIILDAREGSARVSSLQLQAGADVKAPLKNAPCIERNPMSILSNLLRSMKEFSAKYPAVLSGYIIYSYLFITMVHFFLKVKSRQVTLYDIYETFDALPFLWLLSSALVKIIDTRTELHNSEKERMLSVRELETRQTQLDTMREVAKGFQHKINNPLAIISLALSSTKRAVASNPVILERMSLIEESASRIKKAVIDFSGAQKYEVEHVGQVVGSMASPASLGSSALQDCANG